MLDQLCHADDALTGADELEGLTVESGRARSAPRRSVAVPQPPPRRRSLRLRWLSAAIVEPVDEHGRL